MQDSVKKYIARLTRDRRRRRRLGSIIGMLSLVVAIGVFWQFKITGITMSDGQTPNDADPTADIETAEVWEATLPPLTGVWSEDVAVMAESQLGYAESETNYQLDDDGEPVGYTRYGAWVDQQYQPWDAAFAAFCLHYAGVSDSLLPVSTVSAADWADAVSDSKVYKTGDYEAQRGDVVFVDGTVGIVTGAEGSSLTVIVGDSGNAVAQQSYSASSVSVYASVKAAFDIETGVSEGPDEEEPTEEPEEQPAAEEEPEETPAAISGEVSEKAEKKGATYTIQPNGSQKMKVEETATLSGTATASGGTSSWSLSQSDYYRLTPNGNSATIKAVAASNEAITITHTYQTSKTEGKGKNQKTVYTDHTEKFTITIQGEDEITLDDSGSDYTVTVKGAKNKLNGYSLAVEEVDPSYNSDLYYNAMVDELNSTGAASETLQKGSSNASVDFDFLKMYHIYVKDSEGNPQTLADKNVNLQVTLTYNNQPSSWDAFAKSKHVGHYKTDDASSLGIKDIQVDAKKCTVTFHVTSFSYFTLSAPKKAATPPITATDTTGTLAASQSLAGMVNKSNSWQVMDQPYTGNAADNKTTYSSDGNIRVQKNVIPTGTENEFKIYLSIDYKKSSMVAQIIQNAGMGVTSSNNDVDAEAKHHDHLEACYSNQDQTNAKLVVATKGESGCTHEIKFKLVSPKYGRIIITRYTSAAFANGAAYIRLYQNYWWCVSKAGSDTQADGTVLMHINDSKLDELISHSSDVDFGEITDNMGDGIQVVSIDAQDGTATKSSSGDSITWKPAVKGSAGSDGWVKNAAELVYTVKLTPTQSTGLPLPNTDSSSPEYVSTNSSASLGYRPIVDNNVGNKETLEFPKPAVRGMLYDVVFNKVTDLTSKKGVPGAVFTLYDSSNNAVGTITTSEGQTVYRIDNNGQGFQYGTYTLKETTIPSGYKNDDKKEWTFNLSYTTNKAKLVADSTGSNPKLVRSTEYDTTDENAMYIVNTPDAKKLRITKTDQSGNALSGATFKLTSSNVEDFGEKTLVSDETTGYLMNGSESVLSLSSGTYTLTETDTPDGYNQLTDSITITVTAEGITATYAGKTGKVEIEAEPGTDGIYDMTVTNDAGVVLPMTGGSGTLPYMLAGMLLMLPLAYKFTKRCRGERRFD